MPVAVDDFGNMFSVLLADNSTLTLNKYDREGRLLWSKKRWPSIAFGGEVQVDTDSQGNVYLVCTVPSGGIDGLSDVGDYLIKFDAEGNWYWTRHIPRISSGSSTSIYVDQRDSVFVGGHTYGSTFPGTYGEWSAFVVKYSKSGRQEWARQFFGRIFSP